MGYTTNFKNRKYEHKRSCNNDSRNNHNLRVYKFIRDNGGFENWCMIEIEKYNATDKRDLEKRERYFIETLKTSLNSRIPTRNNKEYREQNKQKIKEQQRQKYIKNKCKIIEYQKKRYEENIEEYKELRNKKFNCECGGKYTYANKQKHMTSKKHQEYIKNKE